MAEARRAPRTAEGSSDPGAAGTDTSGEAEAESGQTSLTLTDERQSGVYEESVYTASRSAESPLDAPNSTTIVTAQDVRLSGLQTPSLVLRRVAGVSILSNSPGDQQLSIRGLNGRLSNRTIVLVDGRSVYLDFLGTTLYNFLPLSMEDIERIEVIRGPASALYGADAMSGIVNIITRPLGEGRSYVTAGMGDGGQYLLRAGAYARADRFRFRVGGGYQRQDMFALEVVPGRVDIEPSGRDPNLGYERLYFHGELSYRFDGGYLVRAGTGIVDGEVTFQGLSRLRQIRGRDGLFAQTFASFETPWGLSARVFWNRLDLTGHNVGLVPGGLELSQESMMSSDIVDSEIVLSQDFDLLGIDNRLIAGVSYRYKEVRWDWLANGSQMQHHGAVFLQDTMRFSDVAQIVLSVRGDLHPLAGPQVSPRGSILFHPTAGQTIRVTGGAAFRSPSFVESYAEVPNETPLRGVTTFGVGNPTLNPERLFSVELGYMNQMTEYFSLELNGYYNFVIDQILLTQNRAFRLWDFRNDSGLAQYHPEFQAYPLGQLEFANEAEQFQQIGGEFGVRVFPVQGLDVYANYAIHETSHVGGPRGALTDDARTSAHMVNGGVQYRAPFGLDLSIDVSWQSSQIWYEQVIDTARGGVSFQRFRLPSYTTLNARIGYRLFDDQLELAVIGMNLIDAGHREHPFGQPIDRRFLGTATVRF
jgi:iron complex outermembrane receptor protein